ncbi:MAG: hypothetical protein ACLRVT_07000 [Oscillospiraceae bacterium]
MNHAIYDTFSRLHADEALKRRTRDYLSWRAFRTKRRGAHRLRYAMCGVCVLFMMLGIWGYSSYLKAVAVISVDVNPSIELEVNRFDRVISATGLNAHAKQVLQTVGLRNKSYEEALSVLLESEEMSGYLTQDAVLEISVACDDEPKSQAMQERILECAQRENRQIQCSAASTAEIEAAHQAGLSLGKYRAYLELRALEPDVKPEEVQGLSMRQIRNWIDRLAGTDSSQEEGPHGSGKGQQGSGGGQKRQHRGGA